MNRLQTPERSRIVKKTTLAAALIAMLGFSLFIGVIGVARGVGSIYPQLNLVAGPFVCHGEPLTYQQHTTQVAGATYWNASWYCAVASDVEKEVDASKVYLSSGLVYGLAGFVFFLFVTYLYWNSSIGPARNDGLRLW